jgi:hypothetical protein
MKRTIPCRIIITLLCVALVHAQETKVVEPEALNVVYSLDAAKNSLAPLDREAIKMKAKAKLMGLGGAKGYAEVRGEKASVRFKADEKPQFVVSLANGIDPGKVRLYRFEAKSGKRQVILENFSYFGGKAESGLGSVQVNASRHGQASYKLTPSAALSPGEYGFSYADSQEVFCFGIDTK